MKKRTPKRRTQPKLSLAAPPDSGEPSQEFVDKVLGPLLDLVIDGPPKPATPTKRKAPRQHG